MSTHNDGTWTSAAQHGPEVITVDEFTRSKIVRRTMRQTAADWTAMARGNTSGVPSGTSQLLYETDPEHVGNGIVQWDRIYGAVPGSRNEYRDYVFSYQNITIVDDSGTNYIVQLSPTLVNIPMLVTARFAYAYFDAAVTAPSAVTLFDAFQIGSADGVTYFFGDIPDDTDTEWVGGASTLDRWRNSDIYERVTIYVPANGLTEALELPP